MSNNIRPDICGQEQIHVPPLQECDECDRLAQEFEQAKEDAIQAAADAEEAKDAIENMGADATSLPAGSSPTITKTVDPDTGAVTLHFGIPEGEKGDTGEAGADGQDGQDGADGVSPTVTITPITGGYTLTIIDADHPSGQSINVMNGSDGVSPDVTITTISGGHRITITDADHPSGQSFDVMDGTGAVTDVQQNGVSVLNGSIANIIADANVIETVKVDGVALTPDVNKAVDIVGKADRSDLADISETLPTASQTINNGTYFYLDGVLVQATADIASGATFTLNTNYVVSGDTLNELNSKLVYGSDTDKFLRNDGQWVAPQGGFSPQVVVTAPTGSTVTLTKGGTTLTATESSGTWTFDIPEYGTWTATATKGGQTAQDVVSVTEVKQYQIELAYTHIYGVSKTYTDAGTSWTRTDEAVGLSATAGVGTSGYSSDFDDLMPWSGMVRETLSTGDVMVKIPKFYYKRTRSGSVETIQIADGEAEGFTLHPLFTPDGGTTVYDYVHIGAYHTGSGYVSKTGLAPLVNITRPACRSGSAGKGTGWSQYDIAALSALQMLYDVEFADNDSQTKLGRGYCDGNSSAINSGACDSMYSAGVYSGRPSGTDGKTAVMYRGIENPFGNVWQWVDGVNWNGGTYCVCFDPTKYADDTATNYTQLSYTGATNWSSSYITQEGLDTNNPAVMLPSAAGSGSASTYLCDACWSNPGWRVCVAGGYWRDGSDVGLFTVNLYHDSSFALSYFGGRLLKRPA